ncbi:MAG: ATP-dependent RecD-like DNA helicase [Eubacterium sp.]|nr:ATP-dependent RecD-like DNA helicase [Eubacterium sp.]
METLKGTVAHVIFHNDKNGYTVADFDIDGQLVTAVGTFDELQEGEFLKLTGFFKEHQSYGEQFQVESYALDLPTSEEGIIRYLSSGLLPGIGEKTAIEIVARFGKDTLDILDQTPDRLGEVKGIGKKTLAKIKEVYSEQKEIRDVMIKIQEYGISSTYAMKLYKTYQGATVQVLLDNPYQIIKDVRGIGFKIADQIAGQLGFDAENPKRILAGIDYCLQDCYSRGNTYMTEADLVESSAAMLGVSAEEVAFQLQELALSGNIKLEFIDDAPAYYPTVLFEAEDNAALSMVRLSRATFELKKADIPAMIADYEKDMHISLDERQAQAISTAIENGIVIITGGPGTGKTTIINGIVYIFKRLGMKTVLAAPTGRAAKRITETTGEPAKTIHRLLEYDYSGDDDFPSFSRDEENPLETDAIIVDESSMIDIVLLNSMLEAIKPGTRLILVGDADQLPSVGPGNVLQDLIESGVVKVVRLEKIYRQSETSMISVNAHAINEGLMPEINNQSDFMFVRKMDPEVVLQTILELVSWRIPEKKGFDAMKDIQVISPVKKGKLGVISLNKELQEVLNPPAGHKAEKTFGTVVFREGDKVMQIKNNYKLVWEDVHGYESGEGVYNGDIGLITAIDAEERTLEVRFTDDKQVVYSFEQLEELTHAYAMTVHKSQGSEFPVVIMPMVGGPPMFLNRKLLYTAVTRAKKMLMLIGPQNYFYRMVKSGAVNERRTALKQRIKMYSELGVV